MNAAQQACLDWLMQAANRGSPYVWWYGGELLTDGAPAWSDDTAPLPSIERIVNEGGFCAAVGNLLRRYGGLDVPDDPEYSGPDWDGGVQAWYNHFYHQSVWYSQRTLQDGDVLISPYYSPQAQGHFAVYYQGYILEWITSGGLVWQYTPEYSDTWGNYELVVPVDTWLPVAGGSPLPDPTASTSALTEELLVKAMTGPWAGPDLTPERAHAYLPHLVAACKRYEINTRARLSAFLGQTGAESGSFTWFAEIGGGGGSFGNYYGRGPMQMTWADTYRAFQDASGYPAYDNPDIVADDPEVAFMSAAWFWSEYKELNEVADRGTWDAYFDITGYIWGWGARGPVPERDARYSKAWDVLPANLTLEDAEPDQPGGDFDVIYSKYTFVAAFGAQVDAAIANAAYMALEACGVDALVFNGQENIKAAGDAALAVNDIEKLNCLVVGFSAHSALSEAARGRDTWADNEPVWALWYPKDDALTLHKVKNWALPWIADEEKIDRERLLTIFKGLLLAVDNDKYAALLEQADQPDQPAPPSPPLTLEERVERLEKKVGIA